MSDEQNKLIVFQEKEIRRVFYKEEWFFSVIDVIRAIIDVKNARRYWSDLKRNLQKEGFNEVYEKIVQLKMKASDGKMRQTDTANTETLFRIIQSIPSKKAEPFKQWLAKVGYERIQEIENPELAAERARQYYKALGYNDDWIVKRLQSIEIRGKLTDEWKERGIKEGREYAILTAEISRATFGITPSEYKKMKDLKRENLRDHMTDLELIFTMLGETSTKNETTKQNAKGFNENKRAAKEGGAAAGDALKAYEKRTDSKVVTSINFKHQIEEAKKSKLVKGKDDELNI
jgi:hypothetical protein